MEKTSMRAGTGVGRKFAFSSLAVALGFAISLAGAGQANAYVSPLAPVDLGAAQSFAVLGAQTVTNTGPSTVSGDVGVTAGSSITGFPPGVITGAYGLHANTSAAIAAKTSLGTAYGSAAGTTPPDALYSDLAGLTLTAGVYSADNSTALSISGTLPLTLDGQGNPDSVWIFQAQTTLITASASKVMLSNGANPCNVFWQVGSSATLGTGSTMVGTIMAQQSITATTGAKVQGRLLALNGAVTLDNNVINAADCAGTAAAGGTKPIVAVTPSPAPERPKLAETGVNAAPYIFGAVTLIGGGVVLLMVSGAKSRRRRGGRLSQ